jgi:hypothetical protein
MGPWLRCLPQTSPGLKFAAVTTARHMHDNNYHLHEMQVKLPFGGKMPLSDQTDLTC